MVLIVVIFCTCFPSWALPAINWKGNEAEHMVGCTFKITDEKGNLITMTARKVEIGDEIITSTGKHYQVVFIAGNKAEARLLGKDEDYLAWVDYFENFSAVPVATMEWRNRPVGIYHTHSDESYVPTDGKPSIPFQGGIYQVGSRFAKVLRDNKVKVMYYKTPHDPHDANAYARSRRTAMGLLKSNPIALFDIHRDGIPDAQFFEKKIGGKNIAQLRIVVGRQNPKMKANMDFARRIMSYANKKYPGIVKEIYKAYGNYNQDLLSTSLLLEAGTYTNSKEWAERGIELLAHSVPVVLGVDNPGGGVTSKEAGRMGWNVALWLILITLGAGVAFILINFGWQGTVERIREWGQRLAGGELWARLNRLGAREKEEGPLADYLRLSWQRIKEISRSKRRI